ncbi:MAG: GntR family transcriptional regulator [Burkholderiaceae bacterium]|nr:GntR family transcriptional regulator [Burkholderiaceae bacterium]
MQNPTLPSTPTPPLARPKAGGNAVERAYDGIKTAIFAQEFAPGSHLTEVMLTKRLGISRTPIREAFRRLGAEGWLEILPDQGVRVSEWSHRDIDEIFEIRVLLESYIARRAAACISTADIERLRVYTQQMEGLHNLQRDDMLEQRSAANSAFHNLLVEAAGNSRLHRILQVMIEIPVVKRTFKSYTAEESQRSVAHHYEIIAALEAGDGDWAAAIMRSHILAGRHAVARQRNTAPSSTHTEQGITQ